MPGGLERRDRPKAVIRATRNRWPVSAQSTMSNPYAVTPFPVARDESCSVSEGMSRLMLNFARRVALLSLSRWLGVMKPKGKQHHEEDYDIAAGPGQPE